MLRFLVLNKISLSTLFSFAALSLSLASTRLTGFEAYHVVRHSLYAHPLLLSTLGSAKRTANANTHSHTNKRGASHFTSSLFILFFPLFSLFSSISQTAFLFFFGLFSNLLLVLEICAPTVVEESFVCSLFGFSAS